ncbi:MAG: TIGR02217 family protein, partial [Alphaproteobacteria bacterium]
MHWLATSADALRTAFIKRFDPRFWTVNFPRPMMASVTTQGTDGLAVDLLFYRKEDLAGLIWESEDTRDHPLLAYETARDYRGVMLSFRWQSSGIRDLAGLNGPTLTIEGRDQAGAARTWFVRLWNYAVGSPEDAVVTLDFDALDGGFSLPGEADPVFAGDIDRMFISMVPPAFDGTSTGPLESAPGVFASVSGTVTVSAITVDGPASTIALNDAYVPPHGLRLSNGYDDSLNLTPERLMRNALQLGYRGWIDHYVGMSHYFHLAWDPLAGRFLAARDGQGQVMNGPARAWHADFLARAAGFGFKVVHATSFEMFDDYAPEAWKQRTHDGSPALTGWVPPSTLLAPTHGQAMDHVRDAMLEAASLAVAAGAAVHAQIGEPWWWYQLNGSNAPCFYDATTEAAYTAETGQPVPARHLTIFETPNSAQQAYLDWLAAKLGAATLALRDALKAAHPAAQVSVLFFTPQVLDPAAPMLATVNMPADWTFPAFDVFQIEDYDHVIAGRWAAHAAALDVIADRLGYGPADSHYFAGFILSPNDAPLWDNIERAIADGRARGFAEVFVWAYPQIVRDGFTHFELEQAGMTAFHDVRFPTDISFGSSGGPGFSTSIVETASGVEQRNANWAAARARYDVGTGIRGEDDLAA